MQKRGYFLLGIFLIISGTIISTDSLQNITGLAIASDTSELSNKLSGISFIFAGLFSLFLSKKRKVKGQAAIEFLMTYGWAILAAIVVLGVLSYFGIFNPGALVRGSAIVSPPFYIIAWSVDSNEILLDVENRGSETYSIHKVTVKLDGETISCNTLQFNPVPTISQNKNRVFTIPCPELNSKKRIKGDIFIEYSKTSSNLIQTASGTISDKIISTPFSSSVIFPTIEFKNPTPSNGAIQEGNSIFVNVSASDTNEINSFIDFDNTLVSWWRMDDLGPSGTVVDYNGKNNATTFGNVIQNVSGIMGKSFSFDGGSGYVDVGNVNINIGNSFAIGSWIKAKQRRGQFHAILSKGIKNTGHYEIYIDSSTGKFSFYSNDISGPSTGSKVVDDDIWHHVMATYNSTNLILYVDGIVEDNFIASGTVTAETENFNIARQVDGGGTMYFNGSIDDVMIFNRSLSASEVMALYANSLTKQYSKNFTNLAQGIHKFKAYAQDLNGNVKSTELRTINITSDDSFIYTCTSLNETNKIYNLRNNISSSGTCIQVLANNVTLNGNGYSITGTINGSNSTGNAFSNFTLKNSQSINGYLTFRGGADPSTGIGKIGGTVVIVNSTILKIETSGGSATISNTAAGAGGAVTVTNSIIQNITTRSGSIVSGYPAGGSGGAVNVTNSTVILIETMAGNNLYPGSAGGAVTLINSNVTLINSTGSASYSAGKGGVITVTNSNVTTIFSPAGWSGSYGNIGGMITVTNSNVLEIFNSGSGGNYNAGSGGAVTVTNSNVTNITSYGGSISFSGFSGVMNGGLINITSIYPVTIGSIVGYGGNANNRTASNGSLVIIQAPIINLTSARINITNGISSSDSGTNGTAGRLTLSYSTLIDTNAQYSRNIFLTLTNGNGVVTFIPAITSSFSNISQNFLLNNNFVSLNTSLITPLNRSANITLYGLPTNFVNPTILKNGVTCSAPSCNNFTSLNAGTVRFNVTSWTDYKIG